jgi:hypothetical protein
VRFAAHSRRVNVRRKIIRSVSIDKIRVLAAASPTVPNIAIISAPFEVSENPSLNDMDKN